MATFMPIQLYYNAEQILLILDTYSFPACVHFWRSQWHAHEEIIKLRILIILQDLLCS